MAQLKPVLSFPAGQAAEPRSDSLSRRYAAVRAQTELLTSSLTAEDQMVQSCPEASPVKWHLAHTTWFFETFILAPHAAAYRPFDSRFRDLFNSYYNAVGSQPDKALRNTFSRPGLDEVCNFRKHVDSEVEKLLAGTPADTVLDLVELGLNHEQQHQELLVTDIKHAFWSNPLRPAYHACAPRQAATAAVPQKAQTYSGGLAEIGASENAFRFDNEGPRHKVFLQPFRIAMRPATCGEYLAFIDDRGYQRPELWLSDGWKAVQTHHWTAPLYWEKADGGWMQFTCSGMRRIEESEPVCHVSFYEAEAFARWAGARLPTEFEWETAAAQLPVEGNLLESGSLHPQPAAVNNSSPLLQIFGDVWEWTASAYLPYPGFKPAAGALGEYNGKFMSGQMVLRGGSCATPQSHIRATYRNFFQPEIRWQFSGIRLADDSL